jgi:TonB-dependent SusC/RagA subfamily outer membrane receptor
VQKAGKRSKEKTTVRENEKSVSEPEMQKGKFSNYRDIYDLIRSELSGIRVNGSSIVVMGSATFGGSNEPLLVVDGIPVNQINDIFPGDVKSVRLLKGSSAAGCGMRGANGVILITTLRGSDKK